MKVLYKIVLISGIILTLLSCKQKARKDASNVVETEDTEIKEVSQKKSQTIEEFLQQLQTAVQNNDIPEIENKLKFPFEFSSGGESAFYDSYKELKDEEGDKRFNKILEAKFIGIEEGIYKVRYQDHKNVEYFVTYYITKEEDSFKVIHFAEPF